jgi:hypothetical protein
LVERVAMAAPVAAVMREAPAALRLGKRDLTEHRALIAAAAAAAEPAEPTPPR